MPGLYTLKCDRCDFHVGPRVMSITLAVKDDGREIICPHPSEVRTAEGATGKKWHDLMREGRILYRYGFVCLACGKFGYYGPDQLHGPARRLTHIGNIVHQPTTNEAKNYTCTSCGKKAMYPLCGDTGCLLAILNLLGLFRKRVACPKCNGGNLRSELVAIS